MNDDQALDQLNAGFAGEEMPTETPAATPDEAVAEPAASAPKFASITEEDWNNVRSAATAITEIKAAQEKQFGTAFGKLGGLERTLQQMREAGTGQSVVFDADDFAELQAEYPELADLTLKGMNKALGKIRSGGGSPADIDRLVQERLAPALDQVRVAQERIIDLEMRSAHPDWKQVVASPAFTAWTGTLPAEERDRMMGSADPDVAAQMIAQFKAAQKKPVAKPAAAAPAVSSRQKRFESAVTPKGTGGHAPGRTAIDDLNAGFYGT